MRRLRQAVPDVAALALEQYPRARLADSDGEVVEAFGTVRTLAARWTRDGWVAALDGTLMLSVDALGRPVLPVYATANPFDLPRVAGWVVAAPPWRLDPAEVVDVIGSRRRTRSSSDRRGRNPAFTAPPLTPNRKEPT